MKIRNKKEKKEKRNEKKKERKENTQAPKQNAARYIFYQFCRLDVAELIAELLS